ncbi:xylose isomerase, partial [Weizmannia coagulans]|nr:xylose isomerase [Heyndrickxia coagulans]
VSGKADFKSLENYILDKKEIINQSGRLEQLKNTLNHYIVQEAYQSVNA